MKKLALVAFAFASMTATGCIFVSDDTGETAQFNYAWTVDPTSACNANTYVSVLSTPSVGQAFDDIYSCTDLSHDSPSMPLDSYVLSGSLYDDNNTFDDMTDDINLDGPINVNATLDIADQIKDAPLWAFQVGSPASDVDFGIDYGAAGGMNCTETMVGGSGVVQQLVSLYDVGGAQCLPFNMATNDPAFPTTATCANDICFENSITQTLLALPDGSYELEIIGFKGAVGGGVNACYIMMAPFAFTAPTGDLGNIVVPFNPAPADDAACNATKPLR